MTPTEQDKELREKLAAIEHERWADWQKWVHKVLREANPSPEIGDILERWDRQIETPYEKLSEREKASDMEQVDRYWQLITADRKRVALEARIDPFEFVESCEPDCDDVRHAYHQGQWDMATRIKAQQEEV